MNYYFIGSVCTKETVSQLVSWQSHVDFPGINFQQSLLSGLIDMIPLNIISSPVVSSFPLIKKIWLTKSTVEIDGRCSLTYTGMVNLPVVKLFSKYLRVRSLLKQRTDTNDGNVAIIYALHTPFLLAVASLRKRFNKVCVIVPDLPDYMNGKLSCAAKIGKRFDKIIMGICLRKFDCFVLLSPYMKERLPILNKTWIQLEGIYDASNVSSHVEKDSKKVILYTGNISAKYNIIELLDAFGLIDDPNYRLWIRGNGDTELEIKRRAQIDNRIVYFDRMSKEELTKLQKRATLLINPVFSSNEFTKYFFPSKTMEYLASGTPVLMCDLPCLPNEYKDYLYIIKDESPCGIKQMIMEICEKPKEELLTRGEAASSFILEQKNARIQAGRIVSMLESFSN